MKNFVLLLIFTTFTSINVSKGQTLDPPQKHRIGIGPLFGYDHKLKGAAYGLSLMYEYRPFQKIGFTTAFNYEQTRKNLGAEDFSNTGNGLLKHHMYSISFGARYYFNSFFVAGALGVAHETGGSKMDNGTTFKGGNGNSLYRSFGAGYQLHLKNRDLIEIEIGTFGSKNSMKLGGTVKYKF